MSELKRTILVGFGFFHSWVYLNSVHNTLLCCLSWFQKPIGTHDVTYACFNFTRNTYYALLPNRYLFLSHTSQSLIKFLICTPKTQESFTYKYCKKIGHVVENAVNHMIKKKGNVLRLNLCKTQFHTQIWK